jgi:hypothetical protein
MHLPYPPLEARTEWLRLGGSVDATWIMSGLDDKEPKSYNNPPYSGSVDDKEMDTGTTLLMAACGHGDLVDTVDELLRHGASVNQRDSQGLTALAWAVGIDRDRFDIQNEKRGLEVIKRLLQAGADPTIRSYDHMYGPGRTTLEAALAWPAAEQLLLERHAAFDDAAQHHAAELAAAAGKPGTRHAGLVAIHAVLNKKSFARDEDAWRHYGTSRQRFYEWKALLNGGQQRLSDMFSASVPIAHAVLLECI